MKRSISFILALCMILPLTACKGNDPEDPNLASSPSSGSTVGSYEETLGTAAPTLDETVLPTADPTEAPSEPQETESVVSETPATEPQVTETQPQETVPEETSAPLETSPKETTPVVTEPKVTDPPATEAPVSSEIIPGDPNRVYHTEWGTRPYEFEEVCRNVCNEEMMVVRHWDRYGNIWYDHEDAVTTGYGKSIWQTFEQIPTIPVYFGYGRWSNFHACWDEDGFNEGITDWGWGRGYYYPSFWGNEYEPMYSPCPVDFPVICLYGGHTVDSLRLGGENRQIVQEMFSLTDEQVEMILQDPTTFPIPDSGYYG